LRRGCVSIQPRLKPSSFKSVDPVRRSLVNGEGIERQLLLLGALDHGIPS
jgi:hypothetical protein